MAQARDLRGRPQKWVNSFVSVCKWASSSFMIIESAIFGVQGHNATRIKMERVYLCRLGPDLASGFESLGFRVSGNAA